MKIIFQILLASLPILSIGQTKLPFNKNKSTITYAMNHIMHAWDGTSNQLNGLVQLNAKGQIEKVAMIAKVSSFDSKSSNRDAHMLEVVESLKFPNISFQSTSVTETSKDKLLVKGILDFHGVKKETSFEAISKKKDKETVVSGNFIFLLEDFKIERPSFMLTKVDNEVKVNFEITF
jgi:polyisoprenoid-binding protein YceI